MPTERRPFHETGPLELDPISDSDWSKLSEAERADLLLLRHHQLMNGQSRIWDRLNGQADTISRAEETARGLAARVDEQVLPMLRENTTATNNAAEAAKIAAEAAAKVAERFDAFAVRAESLLDAWASTQGFGRVVGWVGESIKKAAWIAIPAAAAVGAWNAIVAWVKAGAPGVK